MYMLQEESSGLSSYVLELNLKKTSYCSNLVA